VEWMYTSDTFTHAHAEVACLATSFMFYCKITGLQRVSLACISEHTQSQTVHTHAHTNAHTQERKSGFVGH